MRSRAVGIDKQKNGFVNLGNFPVCFELFQTVYRLRTAPSHAGGCLGPPCVGGVWDPAELGPHNARFYYGILLENGSNVRGVRQHVTFLLMIQSSID